MRIGLFGGSFDPIHHGHLLHAQDALERCSLDRVYFIPAAQAPLKSSGPPGASAKQRMAMIDSAIESIPHFFLLRDEIERGGVSYTVDTVRRLKQSWPEDDLFWIIGGDQVAQLDQWREIDELLKMTTFLCFHRPGFSTTPPKSISAESIKWVSSRKMEFSSTEIRNRATNGQSLDFFLPTPVIEYIKNNQLYRFT